MLALPAEVEQVRDRMTVRHQPIRDEGPVAMRRVALGAQDADPVLPGCKRGSGALELVGLHVLGVGLAHASERLSFPHIRNAV